MRTFLWAFAVWVFMATLVTAAESAGAAGRLETVPDLPTGLDPVKAGQELAARVRSLAPAENTSFQGTLKLKKPGKSLNVPVTATTEAGDASWQVTYETTGVPGLEPERLTIKHSTTQPTLYLYAHGTNLSQPIKLTGEQARLPFAASDFWMADLGLEFLHWPRQQLVKHEMRRGRSTRVLDSFNPQPAPGSYSRVRSWIDVESDGVLNAEAYDTNNKMLKEFKVDSLQKIQDRWQIKELLIRNVQSRTSTQLLYQDPSAGKP